MRTIFVLLAVLGLATVAVAQEREVTSCEICGGEVYQTPKTYKSGRTKYIYMDTPPHKPYCTRCQRDVNNGKIDAKDPPMLAPRDGEEDEPSDNPYAVDKFDWEKKKPKKKDEATEEAESGFGALGWVIGIVVAIGVMLRFFLKS